MESRNDIWVKAAKDTHIIYILLYYYNLIIRLCFVYKLMDVCRGGNPSQVVHLLSLRADVNARYNQGTEAVK